jgi:cystathionine beta-lyase/cystathionine gamma-synthase
MTYKYSTLAVHAGQHPDPLTGAVNVPVYLSSTFELTGIGTDKGWDYSRAGNPTRDRLEEALAALEGGFSGHAFTSGMAAIAGLVAMLRTGDHLVCSNHVYAGTVRFFERIVRNYGIDIEYVDTSNLDAVAAAIRPSTKLVHIESPSNPLMVLTDIAGVGEIAHAHGIEVSVDNTFLSPALQSPLALGADIVMHSTTKHLNTRNASGWCKKLPAGFFRPSNVSWSCAASGRCLCASSSTKRTAAPWPNSSPRIPK